MTRNIQNLYEKIKYNFFEKKMKYRDYNKTTISKTHALFCMYLCIYTLYYRVR